MPRTFRPTIRSSDERARYRRLYATLVALDDFPWRDLGASRDGVREAMAGSIAGA